MAEIERAESGVVRAREDLAKSQNRAAAIGGRLRTASETLEGQQDELTALRSDIRDLEDEAEGLRGEHMSERAAAGQRLRQVASSNADRVEQHREERRGSGFLVGFFGGFLLLGLVRRFAAALVFARPMTVVAGFLGSIVLTSIGFAMSWTPGGLLLAIAGGLALSGTMMLIRIWWVAAGLPRFVAFGLLGLAGTLAIGALVTVLSAAPPAQEPAADDVALVEEEEADPDAEELESAVAAEREAAALETQIADLELLVEVRQARVDLLATKLEAAQLQAAADKAEARQAKAHLADVR